MNRRTLLKSAGLVPAALSLSTETLAKAPALASRTFVLVHGAFHHSLHWGRVAQHLSGLGHRVVSIDLPGHGLNARYPASYVSGDWKAFATEPSPIRDVNIETCAAAVIDVLKTLPGDPRPLLVGHSLGGGVLSRVGELAPERVGRLVYLTAFCPVRLQKASAYKELPESRSSYGGTLAVGNPMELGALRINPRGDAAHLDALIELCYHDTDKQTALPFVLSLTPDMPLAMWTEDISVTRERWGRLPRTFVRCTQDRSLTLALQDLMIRDADAFTPDNPFEQKTLESGHVPLASQPVRLAELLASLR